MRKRKKNIKIYFLINLDNKAEDDRLDEMDKKLEVLGNSEKNLGNFLERYTQSTLAEVITDTIIRNCDRLPLLGKNGMRDGAIDDDIVNEKVHYKDNVLLE